MSDPCEGCGYKSGNRCSAPGIGSLYRFDKRNFATLPCDRYATDPKWTTEEGEQ